MDGYEYTKHASTTSHSALYLRLDLDLDFDLEDERLR